MVKFADLKSFLHANKEYRCLDIYFTPADLNWTLVRTHEDGWFGPYFVMAKAGQ